MNENSTGKGELSETLEYELFVRLFWFRLAGSAVRAFSLGIKLCTRSLR